MKPNTAEVLERVQQLLDAAPQPAPLPTSSSDMGSGGEIEVQLASLGLAISEFDNQRQQVGQLNPRNPGLLNAIIQFFKRTLRRLLSWYTRPLNHTNQALSEALWKVHSALTAVKADSNKFNRDMAEKLAANLRSHEEQINASMDSLREEVSQKMGKAEDQTLTSIELYENAKAAEALWFNEPILIRPDENGRPQWLNTNERIIERAWILRQLGVVPLGTQVLDIGCTESLLPLELASCGYKVTGIDVRPYKLQHPNLRFIQADIARLDLPRNGFDLAIALSTLDHIGLGWYGDPAGGVEALTATVEKIHDVLKPGGTFLLTVPYGVAAVTPLHRILDKPQLLGMLSRFSIVEMGYGLRLDDHTWVSPAEENVAGTRRHDPENYRPGAVALVVCKKPHSAGPAVAGE